MAKSGIPGFKSASTASWAVRDLNRAFNELATTGEVTYKTLSAMVGLLTRMSPVLGLVAEAVFLTYESFQLLKKQDIQDALVQTKTAVGVLNDEFIITAARVSSATGQYAELKGSLAKLAEAQIRVHNEQKAWGEEIAHQEELVKSGKITEEQAVGRLKASGEARLNNIHHLENEIDGLQRVIPLKRLEAEILHTQASAQVELILALRGAATAGGAVAGNPGLDRELAQKKLLLQNETDLFKAREKAGEYEGKAGSERFVNDQKELGFINQQIIALENQKKVIQEVGQMADSAIGGTAAGAFAAYEGAIDHVISMNNLFSDSTGRAFRNAEASVLKSLGSMATVHMLEELAYAATTSLNPYAEALYGPPSMHLEAAGIWGAVAVAAGLGAAALSVNPGTSGGGGGRSHGPTNQSNDTVNVQVVVFGQLDDSGLTELHNQIQSVIERRNL